MRELGIVGTPSTCVSACILRDDRLLIGLRHYTPDKWKKISIWTTPGGRCEAGELVEAALRRETAEEVGITDLEITDFLGIIPGAMSGDTLYVFICRSGQEPRLMEPQKFSEWKWESVDSIPDNFINPAALVLIKKFIGGRKLGGGA